jgi:Tol biopolymer transport system component
MLVSNRATSGQDGKKPNSGSPKTVVAKTDDKKTENEVPEVEAQEAEPDGNDRFIDQTRQLTFEGRRAGEGYFSADGSKMVFQSEREPGNPFYQIYLMDLETGDTERVSPGVGKTTCSWIHPSGKQVMFASTHGDPASQQLQRDELDFRASGKEKRYSWDYDEHFELYVWTKDKAEYVNVTNTRGYDAEGAWSPDGKQIAFASNRAAYSEKLDPELAKKFEIAPSIMMDLYIMDADGSNVRRLTDTLGYDGGVFFSPDGKSICWRRFDEHGLTAEIYTMKLDGSKPKKLTNMRAMSWAPYYHPSSEYLIFTTNKHGFGNFELYLVDAEGASEPIRVTYTAGFDGLPAFLPDGKRVAWTTNRTSSGQSQIFWADWDHEAAAAALKATRRNGDDDKSTKAANHAASSSLTSFEAVDILRHVAFLCDPGLKGRMTGTEGEKQATQYVAAYMDSLGLEPSGDKGWFQPFGFTAGAALGKQNRFAQGKTSFEVDKQWRPVAFSRTGEVEAAGVVFAGYGLVAPKDGKNEEYDSYVHLDVENKWVLAYRFLPEGITPERRQHLARFSHLRYKAMQARERGARGLILVSGPTSRVKNQLVPLQFDGSLSGSSLPVISVNDSVAAAWFEANGKSLRGLQEKLDTGEAVMGFELKDIEVQANIDIEQIKREGRNVLGMLRVADQPTDQIIIVGAHIDHLGQGPSSSSLATEDEREGIHFGADDNASGVAAMLEIAQYMAEQKEKGVEFKRDILFAAWSGEELGLIGSSRFATELEELMAHMHAHHAHGEAAPETKNATKKPTKKDAKDTKETKDTKDAEGEVTHGEAAHGPAPGSLYPYIAACLNLDMVGRLEDKLVLQGVGSSSIWKGEIERRNVPVGLPITIQTDSYLPTDASTFFMRGVPILSAFTGSHSDYHTPRDTPDKLNYEGAAQIARIMGLITRSLALRDEAPDYIPQERPENQPRGRLRVYLGTIPDYTDEVKGLKLSGVTKNAPADKAGLKSGDVVIEIAGRKIENIYDYTFAIEAMKIGEKVKVVVLRGGKKVKLDLIPGSRD